MKILFYLLFTFLIVSNGYSQDFEGIIDYEVTFKNPMPNQMTDEEFYQKMGFEKINQKYFYNGSHYKSIIKESGLIQLYDPNEKRLYAYIEGQETATWTDVTKAVLFQSTDEEANIVTIEELDLVDTILGIPCRSIRVSTSGMLTTYYFSGCNRDIM